MPHERAGVRRGRVLDQFKRQAFKADVFFLVPAFFLFCGGMALLGWDVIRREAETGIGPVVNISGFILVGVGLVFVLAAPITLRRNYSSTLVIRKDHKLITSGLYRVVRHPIYFGAILVALGLPIGTASWVALPPMMLLIPLVVYRMGVEERLLLEEFPEKYRAYMTKTKRIVPFLY